VTLRGDNRNQNARKPETPAVSYERGTPVGDISYGRGTPVGAGSDAARRQLAGASWCVLGGGAVSHVRGTPVGADRDAARLSLFLPLSLQAERMRG